MEFPYVERNIKSINIGDILHPTPSVQAAFRKKIAEKYSSQI